MVSGNETLTERYDIDDRDVVHDGLFEHIQELRKRGYTPKEITPRLRELADSLERHFEGTSSWDTCPAEKDVVLPGDCDGAE